MPDGIRPKSTDELAALEGEANPGPDDPRVEDGRHFVERRRRGVGHADRGRRAGVGQVEDVELQRRLAEAAER